MSGNLEDQLPNEEDTLPMLIYPTRGKENPNEIERPNSSPSKNEQPYNMVISLTDHYHQ